MRNNKLLSIKKIFYNRHNYSYYSKIFIKLKLHINILNKINQIIKNYFPKKLHNWYNAKSFVNNILIIETNNSSSMMRFLYVKQNIISLLKKNILPSLKNINIKINPTLLTSNNTTHNKYLFKQNILSKNSAIKLLNLAKKSPIKLRYIIEQLASLANLN
ncbi:DUF721 domain-containing protein [Enterobacteriaceae endosymbiont of Plateumaris braccata]|uniref:DUF721 domain-containing protein n=1 Tax=Enterobacteriaceae endosymbiont of Plateumaris braccata TaxID=2675793 RepID=UPI001449D09E|nr:DUF721 domain-containing protein [Enterobacteriaceae endosymbiont of Plateumaris braccata]QJC28106.1 DUF721 domain-containing protein [Enterobacteriaceae endosymbiont of Plateumaris braccata]